MDGTAAKPPLFDFTKDDIMRGVEILIAGIVGILLIFFVLRPIMKSAGNAGGAAGAPMLVAGGGGPVLAGQAPGGQLAFASAAGGEALALPAASDMDQRIDIARIEGQVKLSSVKKVADFVDKHPDESVSILRSWLHES